MIYSKSQKKFFRKIRILSETQGNTTYDF